MSAAVQKLQQQEHATDRAMQIAFDQRNPLSTTGYLRRNWFCCTARMFKNVPSIELIHERLQVLCFDSICNMLAL